VKCHGPGGKGDGPAAATLATNPRNFSDCAAMGKSSHDTMGKSSHDTMGESSHDTMGKSSHDTMMFNVIKNGGAAAGLSKDMPAWSSGFEDGEIHDLVAYVKTFCKK
jgi:Cytochrome C oxidase, cbb3-type, subunit III